MKIVKVGSRAAFKIIAFPCDVRVLAIQVRDDGISDIDNSLPAKDERGLIGRGSGGVKNDVILTVPGLMNRSNENPEQPGFFMALLADVMDTFLDDHNRRRRQYCKKVEERNLRSSCARSNDGGLA